VEDAARLLHTPPVNVRSQRSLPALEGELSFVYRYVGAPDRALEYAERSVAMGFQGSAFDNIWQPSNALVRGTERFKALMRSAGLVDYWKVRGWPDLCHPIGDDDFECD